MTTLVSRYDGIVCDLDGVVYKGTDAVPHAVEALGGARTAGTRIVYATNNASRPPREVADQLGSLGLTLVPTDVVTSSQAGAHTLAAELPAGAPVLAVGGEGVTLALAEVGLRAVRPGDPAVKSGVRAVLQGLGRDVTWTDLAEAAFAIQGGARWVATNADTTLPTHRGLAPGNGALVGVVRHAVAVDPVVVGKPESPLYMLAARVLGTDIAKTLAIGDRLDTDLAGAVNTGMDSLYVATGVSSPRDVALAGPAERPRYLARDLRALHRPYVAAEPASDGWFECDGARARVADGKIETQGSAGADARLRVVVAACWAAADAGDDLSTIEDSQWQQALERTETT
ncbi:HAD superfamily hydrolase (TIGR01450 family) [Kineosphaera limosa]|uniref:Putative hydrolase n=1 Tax=Kineosphaera limosa NBRC 100340 TaxID=1184609 RepID=K6WX11_9MICO|nr:HAD-IIA family hydrolase [Kineosphaera limosa]NYD99213.1 HAD superfamily hydrolase (TIGR01450 family) [Kineosphaera limosa]GAB98331.1 putative hydrolase [Kineosphaera limosa NBRC 100340]